MYLVYQPEGSDEPTRWEYNPRKLMATEREALERRTERPFRQFTADVVAGHALCRRALLFMFLRRSHPKTRWEDVDFAWDELTLEFSRSELRMQREKVTETLSGDQLASALVYLDEQIEKAYDDGGETGKAQPPTVD